MTIVSGILKYQNSDRALLECDLGKFVINDKRLEQFPTGNYKGLFELIRIIPVAQMVEGGLIVETAAELKTFALTDSFKEPVKSNSADLFTPQTEDSSEKDKELFGTLWPLGGNIKQDFTLDRDILRKQSQRLKELGYVFDKDNQTWLISA